MKLKFKINDFYTFNTKRVSKYDLIQVEQSVDGSEIETYANCGLKIMVVTPRISFDTKYFLRQENMFMMSSRGNDDIHREYFSKHDCSKYTLAFTHLAFLKFDPIINELGVVTGTKSTFMSITDYGGSLPKRLLKSLAPKGFTEFYDEFVGAAKKIVV